MLWVVEYEMETLKWTFIYTHSIIIEQKSFDSEYTKLCFCITRIKCHNLLNLQYFCSVHSSKNYYHHSLLSSFCNVKIWNNLCYRTLSFWMSCDRFWSEIYKVNTEKYYRNENNKLNKVLMGRTSELFFFCHEKVMFCKDFFFNILVA